MHEKLDGDFENKIIFLAENRIKTGNFKVFDHKARIIKRDRFPELVSKGKTDDENCLIVASSEGETLVITREFERILFTALKNRF